MGNEDMYKLMVLHDAMMKEINSSSTCKEKLDYMMKELYSFKEIISSFFVGKENTIKNIYKSIRQSEYPYNKVTIYDINSAIHSYEEYFEGMKEFAYTVCDLQDNDEQNVDAINDTIRKVAVKDSEFVKSLFEKNKEESDIDNAMKDVESLIVLDAMIDEYIREAEQLCEKICRLNTEKYKESVNDGYNTLLCSITTFITLVVKHVFITFSDIEESMKERTPVHAPINKPTYQLF